MERGGIHDGMTFDLILNLENLVLVVVEDSAVLQREVRSSPWRVHGLMGVWLLLRPVERQVARCIHHLL